MRRLRWIGRDVVYVPRLERQMREGIEFEASDDDASTLMAEGLAEAVMAVQATRERRTEELKRPVKTHHVTVTDTMNINND